MRVNPNSTIRHIALHIPGSAAVFQQEGIDFASDRTLEEVCVEADLSIEYLGRRLEAATGEVERQAMRNWHIEPLFILTSHIVNVHHAYARHELPRLAQQARLLSRSFAKQYPELMRIEVLLRAMIREFSVHMQSEEQMIFPYIVQLEAADEDSAPPQPPSGVSESPLRHVMAEHDSAVEMLHELQYLTSDFTPPADADPALVRFYSALDVFEGDMQAHIELEDNVLFPRALELEAQSRPALAVSREDAL